MGALVSSVIRKKQPSTDRRQCSCGCGAWLLPGIAYFEGHDHDDGRTVAYCDLQHFIDHMRAINQGASK